MQTFVVASANLYKIQELKNILSALNVELKPQSEFGVASIAENGLSFVENSLIKARHASKVTGLPALADDSGLLVDVLGGAPGIHSARYAGRDASDADNLKRLLNELEAYDGDTFAAHFHCAATYVRNAQDPIPVIAEADWHGYIIRTPKGRDGFGYDPVFYIPELNSSAAELSRATKNRLSHRAVAFQKIMHQTATVAKATCHSLPPLSLYIHLPWCVSKCPYCDFNSHAVRKPINQNLYIDALIADLECDLPYVQNRLINSLFIGGGTPTLFDADTIALLLERVQTLLRLKPECEITMEANPESADLTKLKALREAGINRLSIGMQSLNDQMLVRIGRVHNAERAQRTFENARHAGFANINCDLMFGLPKQTKEQALSDLRHVIKLDPEHISWYQLTIEPNTIFYTRKPRLPDDDMIWQLQSEGIQRLQKNRYHRYEISAYSRDKPCQHNLNYWQFGDYIGIGAGAHGKLTWMIGSRIVRTRKYRLPDRYTEKAIDGNSCVEAKELSTSDATFEFLLNALRLTDGFAKVLFNRTGQRDTTLESVLAPFIDKRWVLSDERYLKPSAHGIRFLNEILEYYLPNDD